MSKLKARAIESLVGAAGGSAAGALVGRLSYTPKEPLEWTDAYGRVQSRGLSPEERAERTQRVLRAAFIGGGVGTASALGGSVLRRQKLYQKDLASMQETGAPYLASLQQILQTRQKQLQRALDAPPTRKVRISTGGLKEQIEVAGKLLVEQEKAVVKAVGTSAERRAAKPFGGFGRFMRDGQFVDLEPDSHAAVVHEHFNQLAKAQGLDRFTMVNAADIYKKAIESALTKKACVLEVRSILDGG